MPGYQSKSAGHVTLRALATVVVLVSAPVLAETPAAPATTRTVSDYLVVAADDDHETRIPMTVITGHEEGPVLALIAGTHGYEYPPILALHRIMRRPELDHLRGTLIMVHIANPSSFFGRTIYLNPADGMNLNRAYPGDPGGSESQRIAHAITTQVIEKADFVIDMHAGDGNEDLRPYVYMPEIGDADLDRAARDLAVAFGLDHIVIDRAARRDRDKTLYTDHTAISRGIPAITTETGGLGSTSERWVSLAEAGILNVMRRLEMLPGDAVMRDDIVWLEDYEVVTSPANGLFRPEVRGGYAIAENGRIGVLVDEFGDELAVIRAPFAGVVNYVIATPPANEGQPLAMISRIAGN